MARSLGGNEGNVNIGRRLDVAVADVEAVAEEQGIAGLQVRCDVLGVDVTLDLVRGQHHDQIGFGDGLGNAEHAQALGLRLLAGLGTFLESNADVHARVAQAQRVGVALAAVTDDGNGAPLDDREVGVVVVVELSHLYFSCLRFLDKGLGGTQGAVAHGPGAAADGQRS